MGLTEWGLPSKGGEREELRRSWLGTQKSAKRGEKRLGIGWGGVKELKGSALRFKFKSNHASRRSVTTSAEAPSEKTFTRLRRKMNQRLLSSFV